MGTAGWAIPWKLASTEGAASTNALLLLAFAATFSTLFTLLRPGRSGSFTRADWTFAALLAVLTLAGNLAIAQAIQTLSPALLTLVTRSEVIFVAILAWPVVGERPDRAFWLGALTTAAGLFFLQPPTGAIDPGSRGLAWALLSVAFFGSMAVLTRLFIRHVDPARVNGLRLWLSVALWFAWHGLPDAVFEVTAAQAGFVALAAFFGPFASRLALMESARYLEARLTTLAMLAAPPITLVMSAVVLGDRIAPRELLGGGIMLLGIAIPVLARRR